ncbi:putative FERM domain-containing protein FRMD8P1 [Acropora millepora]|uniref:putative FERM domain-containing protein FRMD8P1 n=1 Tax=Acropora millepora TaxID=45264 RepID=UPI001CF467A8|nr:putative FERM domain-containing protein FRMD8P1 [Acropora millepora]XP_044163239.1 putative FERM domain-containing protein FRMD8P1 [Acropora millepora]
MALDIVEMPDMNKENVEHPDYKRLYPEENTSAKKSKKPGFKKSISWGSKSDATTVSFEPLTVAVFLVEKSGRLLNLEEGRNTTAGTINTIMAENLSLPTVASQIFCVWLISPLLQLQLKAHHRPFRLRKVWTELLKKFTNVTDEVAEKDEPILSYQRSSFFPVSEEKRIKDDRIIKRLFEEAKYNVLSGNYPMSSSDAVHLGGILCYIENGAYNPEEHTSGFLKGQLTDYLPVWLCKSSWSLRGRGPRQSLEQKLLQQYSDISEKVADVKACHKMFLDFCWSFPFYGSVFFRGQIERPASSLLSNILGNTDVPVRVAINRERVHVIDDNKNDILLSLAFDELSWDFTPAPAHDPGCMDTFWLEFDAADQNNESPEAQRLQIFSKQAEMMDAMVQSCVFCDDPTQESQTNRPGGGIRCRMERLSLSTLEGALDRKKKTNTSFTNPFRKGPKHQIAEAVDE